MGGVKGGPTGPFFTMEDIKEVANKIKAARAAVQHSLEVIRIGGEVNSDTYQWLCGQNRAFGHVLLWLQEADLIESINDDHKQA